MIGQSTRQEMWLMVGAMLLSCGPGCVGRVEESGSAGGPVTETVSVDTAEASDAAVENTA